jgi:hypothetical protein
MNASLHLLLEIIAFCRELVKVAPAALKPICYFQSAEAMIKLQKLDEAEELIHEGVEVYRQEGLEIPCVSGAIDDHDRFRLRLKLIPFDPRRWTAC